MLQYDLSDLLGMDSNPQPPQVEAPKESSPKAPPSNSLFAFMQLQEPIQPSDPLTQFKPEPGPDNTHGRRNATAVSARPELAANAISTYPTPGNMIVPPTTWCEKRASAEDESAPENTTASSSRDCCGPGASSSQSNRVVSLAVTNRRLR